MNRNRIRICGRNTSTLPTPAMTPSVRKLDNAPGGRLVATQPDSAVAAPSIAAVQTRSPVGPNWATKPLRGGDEASSKAAMSKSSSPTKPF